MEKHVINCRIFSYFKVITDGQVILSSLIQAVGIWPASPWALFSFSSWLHLVLAPLGKISLKRFVAPRRLSLRLEWYTHLSLITWIQTQALLTLSQRWMFRCKIQLNWGLFRTWFCWTMAKLCCKNNHAQVFSSVNFREAFCTLTDPIGLALARNEATLKRGFAQPGWPKVY